MVAEKREYALLVVVVCVGWVLGNHYNDGDKVRGRRQASEAA